MAAPCPPSADSVSRINSCPMTTSSWNKRALEKNCSMYSQTCIRPLEYHCVLGPYGNESLEVCAPKTWLDSNFCPSYNLREQRILDQFNCLALFPDCPKKQYFSNTILNYKGCLKQLDGLTISGNETTMKTPLDNDNHQHFFWLFLLISMGILMGILIYKYMNRKKRLWKELRKANQHGGNNHMCEEERFEENPVEEDIACRIKPKFSKVTHSSFTVAWDKPKQALANEYTVYFRKFVSPGCWEVKQTENGACSHTIVDLPANTKFVVKVLASTDSMQGSFGYENYVTTKTKLKSDDPTDACSTLKIDIPYLNVKLDEQLKIKKIRIGKAIEDCGNGKSVIIFSTPHSGKTTLLEGIMNYILGVLYTDKIRFQFTPEIGRHNDWTVAYQFLEHERGKLDEPLTLIDIPRMQGTKQEHAKKIYLQLNSLLNSNEKTVDCICFVVQANDFSLTANEIEHIQVINYLFQSNSQADMFCFYTFADAGPVYAENFLKSNNVSFSKSFYVNWATFYQHTCLSSPVCLKSNFVDFKEFFNYLKKSSPKTLRKKMYGDTRDLENTKTLLLNIVTLQPEVSKDLALLSETKEIIDMIIARKEDILCYGNVEFRVKEIKQTKHEITDKHQNCTFCILCSFICHYNCVILEINEKFNCVVMRKGCCTSCKEHCDWYFHTTLSVNYHYESVKNTKSYLDLKAKYEKLNGKSLEFVELIDILEKDKETILNRLLGNVSRIKDDKNELLGIKNSPLEWLFDDTINGMINEERKNHEAGFDVRIAMLKELKNVHIKINN
ncbi:uncharacterized protein LOC144625147 [Crassostrea virginica]